MAENLKSVSRFLNLKRYIVLPVVEDRVDPFSFKPANDIFLEDV